MTRFTEVSFLVLLIACFDSRPIDATEYCWESFNVTCRDDEVILMTAAYYGRMKFGRCLPRDYYVGCASDILPYMDRKCSGRRACALEIPDTELHNMQPCPKDLMVYLEATYVCVKVAQSPPSHSCRSPNQLSIKSSGYLSSIVTLSSSSSSPCPWIVTVSPGQRINITLLDFAVNEPRGQTTSSNVCVMYGVLRETIGNSPSEVTVCGGERREKSVYLSERNRLVVEIMQSVAQQERPYFLLKYEAIGCPDLKAPPNGWIERQQDRATVSCNQSADVWHLVCSTDSWIGTYHNCSTGSLAVAHDAKTLASPTYPFGVFMAVTIGIALGVFSGLLLLSVVICCQRKRRFRLCLSSYSDASGWSPGDEAGVTGHDLEKTRVLLSEKFCYDLVGRGEISCPARCAGETCGCDGCSSVAFPVVVAPSTLPGNQCFQLQRQVVDHCYERANFVTMATTTAGKTNVGLPPDIQFGLDERQFRSEEDDLEGGNADLDTRKYFTSVELG